MKCPVVSGLGVDIDLPDIDIGGVLNSIWDTLKGIGSDIADLPNRIFEGIKDVLHFLVEMVAGFGELFRWIASGVVYLGELILNGFKSIVGFVGDVVSTLWNGLKSVADKVHSFLEKAYDFLVSLFDRIKEFVYGFYHAIVNTVEEIIGWIVGKVRGALDWFVTKGEEVINTVKSSVSNSFSSLINAGIDALPDLVFANLSFKGLEKAFMDVDLLSGKASTEQVAKAIGKDLLLYPLMGWVSREFLKAFTPALTGGMAMDGSVFDSATGLGYQAETIVSSAPSYVPQLLERKVSTGVKGITYVTVWLKRPFVIVDESAKVVGRVMHSTYVRDPFSRAGAFATVTGRVGLEVRWATTVSQIYSSVRSIGRATTNVYLEGGNPL